MQSQIQIIIVSKEIDKHTKKYYNKGVVVCSYVSIYNYRCHQTYKT
jgi:hypothetical protein